jgi:uncharacterized membrane protein YdfJ with MMPL/SSD domain
VAPVKASVLNLLSLTVMSGVLVWGFQEGGLSWLLGFTPTGVIEPSIPILMFCSGYGLSMDHEVFLLARIKADFDRTGDVVGSVPRGIARSAPLVTAAALTLAASFAVYTHQRGDVPAAPRDRHGARGARGRHGDPRGARAGRDAARRERQLVGTRPAAPPARAHRPA